MGDDVISLWVKLLSRSNDDDEDGNVGVNAHLRMLGVWMFVPEKYMVRRYCC